MLADRLLKGEVKKHIEWRDGMTAAEQAEYWRQEYERSQHEREMERRLKPCPFCGAPVFVEAKDPSYTDGTYDAYEVRCTDMLGCDFARFLDTGDMDEAARIWNRRPGDEEGPAETPMAEPAPTQAALAEDRLLRRLDVANLTGIRANSTLYDMIRRGDFPKPVKLNHRSSAWRESEVRQWIADQGRGKQL